MYDLRFTMYNTHDGPDEGARAAGGKCGWTTRMRCPDRGEPPMGLGQAGPAYVRCTIFDVRFGEFARLCASVAGWGSLCMIWEGAVLSCG